MYVTPKSLSLNFHLKPNMEKGREENRVYKRKDFRFLIVRHLKTELGKDTNQKIRKLELGKD